MIRNLGIIGLYLLLLAAGIPWYWSADESRVLFGVPLWVVASLGAAFLISVLTAIVLLRHDLPGDGDD